ncbi:hypothetical protein OV079_44920 [Nannocystis pusilla]|uniref:Uncharacterized protein n=1 Tax=Nannocystis pusilla TaxID=889268 RepID=A0A9X3EY79_9BACT|nr:hypothetical protein [Nannocystis pusilla]
MRGAVRALRVDRIAAASVTEAAFRVREAEAMVAALGDIFTQL